MYADIDSPECPATSERGDAAIPSFSLSPFLRLRSNFINTSTIQHLFN
jgi:hypothetical protein